jgi:uncharacterized protein involved in exopolysaccharide biosynthesis
MADTQRHYGQVDTTLRDLLAVLFRRKWLILGIFGVTTLLVGIKQLSTPISFYADATLLLNRQGARASVMERSGRALPWTEVIESELEVVKSSPVLQLAQQRLKQPTESNPEGIFLNPRQISRRVSAGIVGESNVLAVTGSDRDPAVAIALTNAVAESYVEYHGELYKLPDPSEMIGARADSTLAELELAEAAKSELLEDMGVNEIREEERSLVMQRERLRTRISDTERELSRIKVELDDALDFIEGRSTSLPFSENTSSVQGLALATSYNQLISRRSELNSLRERFTDSHPRVRIAASDVVALEQEVRERTQQIVATREHERRALEGEQTQLREQIDELSARLTSMPAVFREIDILDNKIEVLEDQYATLSQQAVTAEINRTSFADYSVKILSPALDAVRAGRGDIVRILLAPILALMAGVGLAFYLENLDHSIANREDVERHVNIPVLASFPETRVSEGETRASGRSAIPFRRRGSGRM